MLTTPNTELQATPNQIRATAAQLKMLETFIEAEEKLIKDPEIITLLSRHKPKAMRQLTIYLWLAAIRPEHHKVTPPYDVDQVWHALVAHKNTYNTFSMEGCGKIIEHLTQREVWEARMHYATEWLPLKEDIERFLRDGAKYGFTSYMWYIDRRTHGRDEE